MSQWSGHGTRNTILPGTRMVSPVVAGMRDAGHDEVGATTRQDAHRRAAERVARLGRPDAGRVDDRSGPDVEVAAGHDVVVRGHDARAVGQAALAGRPDAGDGHRRDRSASAVRTTASV